MTVRSVALVWISMALLSPAAVLADMREAPTRRYALFVSANDGGPNLVTLRYAHQDAESIQEVFEQLGGLEPDHGAHIDTPTTSELLAWFERFRERVAEAKEDGYRTEWVFYYSGHADNRGLLLGGERLPGNFLRREIESIDADVRIVILDSCAAEDMFVRTKGGRKVRPPRWTDISDVGGNAYIFAAKDGNALELNHLRGAAFTHYFVEGLKGVADKNADADVTLHEAFDYAKNRTKVATSIENQRQDPRYHVDLRGSHNLVLTRLSTGSARLELGADISGELRVIGHTMPGPRGLSKPLGTTTGIDLPLGAYIVELLEPNQRLRTEVTLSTSTPVVVNRAAFQPVRAGLSWKGKAPVAVFASAPDLDDLDPSTVLTRFLDGLLRHGYVAAIHGRQAVRTLPESARQRVQTELDLGQWTHPARQLWEHSRIPRLAILHVSRADTGYALQAVVVDTQTQIALWRDDCRAADPRTLRERISEYSGPAALALQTIAVPNSNESADGATFGWMILGMGAAGLATGGILTLLAIETYGDSKDLSRDGTVSVRAIQDRESDARSYQSASWVAYGVGGAITLLGAALVIVNTLDDPSESPVGLVPTPHGTALGWRF